MDKSSKEYWHSRADFARRHKKPLYLSTEDHEVVRNFVSPVSQASLIRFHNASVKVSDALAERQEKEFEKSD